MKPITAAEPLVEALLGLDLPVAWTSGTGPPQINAAWLQAQLPMPLSARQDAEQLVIAGAEVETRVDGCMLATDTGALLLALPASEERRAWFLHEVRNLAWAVACGVRELAEANPMEASLVLSDLAFATTHLEHLCHAEMGSRSIGHTTLAGAATAIVRMARRSCDIPIELSCAVDAFAAVQMHPADFTRALLNLILNAAEALRGAASPILPIQVRVGRQEPDGLHRIQVLDRGPGLAGKAAEDLFDRGVSGSAKGTGIGLFEVRSLARLAGGDATLQQRPAAGPSPSCVCPAPSSSGARPPAPANAAPTPACTPRNRPAACSSAPKEPTTPTWWIGPAPACACAGTPTAHRPRGQRPSCTAARIRAPSPSSWSWSASPRPRTPATASPTPSAGSAPSASWAAGWTPTGPSPRPERRQMSRSPSLPFHCTR